MASIEVENALAGHKYPFLLRVFIYLLKKYVPGTYLILCINRILPVNLLLKG